MAKYPIKMLKDEDNVPFVPLVGTDAIVDPSGTTLQEKLNVKLEKDNIIAGDNVTITEEDGNLTISTSGKGTLIDNLDTDESGLGGLDARQGKVLKEMIPAIANNLTTIDATQTLSAYQGYILNNRVVPKGGDEGQVLKKSADGDWQLEWGDAADPNAISGDGSIKKIISLTWAEYNELEEIDENTEYHIIDINTEAQDNAGVPEVYIQETKPDRDDWKLWINPEDETWAAGSEVVNSLEGNETALAPSVAAVKLALELLKPVVVWVSPDNGERSFTPQTLSLDLAQYRYVKIFFRHCAGPNGIVCAGETLIGNDSILSYVAYNGGEIEADTRKIHVAVDGITFSAGALNYASQTSANDNVRCVPLQIWGYK